MVLSQNALLARQYRYDYSLVPREGWRAFVGQLQHKVDSLRGSYLRGRYGQVVQVGRIRSKTNQTWVGTRLSVLKPPIAHRIAVGVSAPVGVQIKLLP